MTRIALALVIFLSLAAQAATLDKPLYAEVFLKSTGEKLSGNVTEWDDAGVVMRIGESDRTLKWSDLTGASAYTLRARVIDRKNPQHWLALGTMGWQAGLREPARAALMTAARLDPELKKRVDQILAAPPTTRGVRLPVPAPVKYIKSTPEQDKEAIDRAKAVGAVVAERIKVKFTEIQTAHFIIFTDWPAAEHNFLKTNVEQAYAAVSKQFDIPVKENVFVGKLPVFMFNRQQDFQNYASTFDEIPPSPNLLGYYAGHGNGTGHMAMWKPRQQVGGNQGRTPEEQWAYTLTHEFTHAFIDRYKSNRRIPRWLNEGVAEVIAQNQFPQNNRRVKARDMALAGAPIELIFEDEIMPGGEYYPVMQTIVQMLIDQNRKGFLKFFDDLKEGDKPQMALKKHFGVDYEALAAAWRQMIVRGS